MLAPPQISLIMTGTLEAYIAYARAAMRTEVGGHPAFVCLFIAYIYFINMTLLNLITGVIVETVLQLARKDEIVEVPRASEVDRRLVLRVGTTREA